MYSTKEAHEVKWKVVHRRRHDHMMTLVCQLLDHCIANLASLLPSCLVQRKSSGVGRKVL